MAHPKRTVEGFEERRSFLTAALGVELPRPEYGRGDGEAAGADDVLDAIAAAWSARRDALGRSGRLPDAVQIDGRGLRMEMVY
jgi:predicted RNase H-like nuclease